MLSVRLGRGALVSLTEDFLFFDGLPYRIQLTQPHKTFSIENNIQLLEYVIPPAPAAPPPEPKIRVLWCYPVLWC